MSGSGPDRSQQWMRTRPTPIRAARLGAWAIVAIVLVYWLWRMIVIGVDLKQDFWVYFAPNRFPGDMNSALEHGRLVMEKARAAEAGDVEARKHAAPDQTASAATLDRPGPGLLDAPLTPANIARRWHTLRPLYGYILRGWVQTYEDFYRDHPDGDYQMDYPPMRLLVMSLWTWHLQTHYPGVDAYPRTPVRIFDPVRHQRIVADMNVVQPVLMFNLLCEAVSAIAIFILVWLWVQRGQGHEIDDSADIHGLRRRWGDPLLLAPVAIFALFSLLRPHLTWQMPLPQDLQNSPIDARVTSLGWWLFLFLRYLAVVCLARFLPRPFRAPMCAMVAATLAWINPASFPDDFGWPQWDCWLPPFFLLSAICVTLDWWIVAGILLGVGCMFKGQLLFVSPVLIVCPLLAGWPGKFFRVFAGLLAGAGLMIWPWLVTNASAEKWVFLAVAIGAFFCLLSLTRAFLAVQLRHTWRKLTADLPASLAYTILLSAGALVISLFCLVSAEMTHRGVPALAILFAVAIVLAPWLLPRRMIPAWILFCLVAPMWLVGTYGGGSESWWYVGFRYGTQRHQDMQLGSNSLSNLSSLLHERYGWNLHDIVGTLRLPWLAPQVIDVQMFCLLLFGSAIFLCTIAAAIHLRRKDPRFLIVLVTPWVLFTVLLTQMTARYMTLPAVVGSLLVGVSVEMSLLPFLQTALACAMLGNQMLGLNAETAPVAFSITQPTYPDLGWLTIFLAALFLVCALSPRLKWRRGTELV